jgi:hypothetical protein
MAANPAVFGTVATAMPCWQCCAGQCQQRWKMHPVGHVGFAVAVHSSSLAVQVPLCDVKASHEGPDISPWS